jgi:hypothetical protein
MGASVGLVLNVMRAVIVLAFGWIPTSYDQDFWFGTASTNAGVLHRGGEVMMLAGLQRWL